MPTRIVHVITRMIVGGAQQVVLSTASSYRNDPQAEFHVVCGPQTGPEGDYHGEIRALGAGFHIVPSLLREVRPLTELRALAALTSLFRRLKPHVVHAHGAKARVLGPVAARLAGVPAVVQTVHGWSFNNEVDEKKRLYTRLERIGLRAVHCSAFVSEKDIEEGIALGLLSRDARERGKVAIVRAGVDLSDIRDGRPDDPQALRSELGATNGTRVVALIQRLSPPKTPDVFIDALSDVLKGHDQTVAWIVGDGDLRLPCEAQVKALGLADRVQFLGIRKDVPALLAAADLAVHSSIREGLPKTILEALAAGTPLIASDVGGARDVLRDGENALIVPPSDPAALAAAIAHVLDDPESAARRAAAGLADVEAFSADQMVLDQHALYQRLLQAKGITIPDHRVAA